jgi:hypothetical protein
MEVANMKQRLLLALGLLIAGTGSGWVLANWRLQEPAAKPDAVEAKVAADAAADSAPGNPLGTLDWLVGDWIDAEDNISVDFSCNYTKNNAFLLRSFRILNAKNVQLSGMQLVAWDAAKKGIRSWTYDSKGGFGEETWTQSGNRYTIRCKYTLPDGGSGSNMQIVTFIDDNKFTWKSVNREIDGEFQPDSDEIVMVRKPIDDAKGGK